MHCEGLPTCKNPSPPPPRQEKNNNNKLIFFFSVIFYKSSTEGRNYIIVCQGLGSPVFDKLEAELAKAVMSLPATKGFEFGSGFAGWEIYIVF